MDGHEDNGGGGGRAEIDTSAPFRSVKEAVILFGERVLAGEVYAGRLSKIRAAVNNRIDHITPSHVPITTELEEAKHELEKEREENLKKSKCINALQEDLNKAKKELKQLKEKESEKQVIDLEVEDLKFVENDSDFSIEIEKTSINQGTEFQKKRYVTFADPPSVYRPPIAENQHVLQRQMSVGNESSSTTKSVKKKKKKPLIPLIGALFIKKKTCHDDASAKGRTSF